MKKNLSFIFLLIFISISIFVSTFLLFQIQKTETEVSKIYFAQLSENLNREENQTITLLFVGDVMLDRGVNYMVKKHGKEDYKFPFLKIADYLKEADVLVGNLESVISNTGKKVGSIYSFRANPSAIEGLKFAGFDLVSLANNHAFDYGVGALEDCLKRLGEAEIDYMGAGFSENEAYLPKIKEIKKVKIAFLAFSNVGSASWQAKKERIGIAWLEEEKLKEKIKIAKEISDLVVVSFHFGDEYQKNPNSSQKYLARLAIDNGADLVVGHHPHVIQPIEKYKNGWIAYSLGNFVFDQNFSNETMEGLILSVLIKNGKIKKVDSLKVKINEFFQPELTNVDF